MDSLISSNELAASGCTVPSVLLIIGVLLIVGGIAGIVSSEGQPEGALGCIPILIGLPLIGWVLWGHDGSFCHL